MLDWKFLLSSRLPKGRRRHRRTDGSFNRRLASEQLEDRRMLATVTVDTNISFTDGDTSSIANLIATPGADGNISLQEAIQAANNTPNSPAGVPDVIEFAIPGAGPHVIDLSGPLAGLNTITDAVTINGYSQTGATVNTAAIGSPINTTLQIVLDGNNALTGALAITNAGGGTTIRGLNIRDFTGTAIAINNSDSNVIAGNFIGTNTAGTAADDNLTGISITGDASGNTIGGAANADRNLISGNMVHGVSIGNGASNNTVAGNFIGMQANGTTPLANGGNGVSLNLAGNGNTIGGISTASRNVISGNSGDGVSLNATSDTAVLGNYVGVDRTGANDDGNTGNGVHITNGSTNNTIGGSAAGARNIISGNEEHGVFIDGNSSDSNTVAGNYIGTNSLGTTDVGNSLDGVFIDEADNNTIGGNVSGAGNLISGNNNEGVHIGDGVFINGDDASGNLVQGNLIGSDVTGTTALPNTSYGVYIQGVTDNTIGGTTAAERNIISGNNAEGVQITGSSATGNRVRGNYIGTQIDGTSALGNAFDGVEIVDGSDNEVGGTDPGAGNVIAFNGNEGVEVAGTPATGNAIRQNSIFNNGGAGSLGIDLSANAMEEDGATANDGGDADEGANRLQNFPVFVGSATLLGNSLAFRYRVDTAVANATYPLTVEFFVADSNNQEGQSFLGSDTYTAAEAQTTKFVIVPAPPVLTNNSFVATATDAAGNTSEFSAPVQIVLPTILGSEPTLIRPDEFINIDQINRYQYISHSTGKTVFRIDFLHALGDLALEVRDENGNLLASSDTSSFDQNFEQVIIPTVGQEPYFINVIAVDFTDDFGQSYALEVENFPAPVPSGVHLDPNSDSGMMNNDGITNDTTPTFFIQTDVLNFVDTNNDGFYFDPDIVGPPAPPIVGHDAIHALTAAEAELIAAGTPEANDEDGGIAVEVTLVNTTTSQIFTFLADPLVAAVPEVYTMTVPNGMELPEGTYLVSARTKVFDGQGDENDDPAQAMGRSDASPPLWFTIDATGPAPGSFDIISSSDSGMFDFDNVTNINQPAFIGLGAEPNTKVTVLAQRVDPDTGVPGNIEIVGTGVVDSQGLWEVTVEPLIDGKYNFFYFLEDAAGNTSASFGQNATVVSNVNVAIGNPGSVETDIQISSADFPGLVGDVAMTPEILDVNVTINIEHGNAEDLDVVLIAPDSTEIELTSDNGGFADNYTDTTFDDSAGTSIVDGMAPFTGRFIPEQPLNALNGLSPFGNWTLRVTDDDGNDIAGQFVSWALDIHLPLMVVIDTEAPNTPFLDLPFETKNITSNNMPTVTITTHDPGVEFVNLIWQDNLKFRIYDRFENTAEFLLYDSALDTNVDNVNSPGDMFTALTLITEMLPEQFFNQVGTNAAVVDVDGVGKLADGVHNLKLEVEDRAGNISHDFLLDITIDTRPQLGAWAAGSVLIDSVDAHYGGYDAHDVTYRIGTDLDYIFAGEFQLQQVEEETFIATGYDTLAAYGRIYQGGAFQYRWLVDQATVTATSIPLQKSSSSPRDSGFQRAIRSRVTFAPNHSRRRSRPVHRHALVPWIRMATINVTDEAPIAANYTGFPIAGDFDGDGSDDLGAYIATTSGGNLFSIDVTSVQTGLPILSSPSTLALRSRRESVSRVPASAPLPTTSMAMALMTLACGCQTVSTQCLTSLSEWFILVSGDDPSTLGTVEVTVLDRILNGPLNGFVPFAPGPVGNDIYAQFGNTFSLPVVGQFPPPGVLTFLVDGMQDNGQNGAEPVEAIELIEPPAGVVALTSQQETPAEETPEVPATPAATVAEPEVVVPTPVVQPEAQIIAFATVEQQPAEPPAEAPVETPELSKTEVEEPVVDTREEPVVEPVAEVKVAVVSGEDEKAETPPIVAATVEAVEEPDAESAPVAPVETTLQRRRRSRTRSLSFSSFFRSSQPVANIVCTTGRWRGRAANCRVRGNPTAGRIRTGSCQRTGTAGRAAQGNYTGGDNC